MSQQQSSFQSLNFPVPNAILELSNELQKEVFEYLQQLDEHHQKAYSIAFYHLGTSFNILKSNGYKEWKNKNN